MKDASQHFRSAALKEHFESFLQKYLVASKSACRSRPEIHRQKSQTPSSEACETIQHWPHINPIETFLMTLSLFLFNCLDFRSERLRTNHSSSHLTSQGRWTAPCIQRQFVWCPFVMSWLWGPCRGSTQCLCGNTMSCPRCVGRFLSGKKIEQTILFRFIKNMKMFHSVAFCSRPLMKQKWFLGSPVGFRKKIVSSMIPVKKINLGHRIWLNQSFWNH